MRKLHFPLSAEWQNPPKMDQKPKTQSMEGERKATGSQDLIEGINSQNKYCVHQKRFCTQTCRNQESDHGQSPLKPSWASRPADILSSVLWQDHSQDEKKALDHENGAIRGSPPFSWFQAHQGTIWSPWHLTTGRVVAFWCLSPGKLKRSLQLS